MKDALSVESKVWDTENIQQARQHILSCDSVRRPAGVKGMARPVRNIQTAILIV
jgi:hypothetical protein